MPTSTRPILKLIVPGFMESLGGSPIRMPALERLLAYGSQLKNSAVLRTHEAWHGELIGALGLGDVRRYASSPLCWLGLGGAPASGVWLHVDPLRMEFSADGMSMQASPAWSAERLRSIDAIFRKHLETTALRLHLLGDRLFVHAPDGLEVDTACVRYALSQPPRAALPEGRDSSTVRRLMTELQMLLHDSSPETDAGNAVWLWGAGSIPDVVRRPLPHVWTNEPFVRGIYMMHDQAERCAAVPATAAGVFDHDGVESIVVVRGRYTASLDAQLFAPALDSLHRGRYERIELFLDGGTVLIQPSLWRRLFARTHGVAEALQ